MNFTTTVKRSKHGRPQELLIEYTDPFSLESPTEMDIDPHDPHELEPLGFAVFLL
jgi:hypothetical protein